MPISLTTVYTFERMIKCQDFVARSRKKFWGFMAVINAVVLLIISVNLARNGSLDSLYIFALTIIVACDITLVFMSFGYPRIALKKSNLLNTVAEYTFEESALVMKRQSSQGSTEATLNYASFFKVVNNKNELYLFISNLQCYVADLSSLNIEQKGAIKSALTRALGEAKVVWKNSQ